MRKQKDPEQPKRARGSFVFFTFDERPNVMAENPGIKFVEMGTLLGEKWRNLPPEEKQRYEDMALEDKQRFNREMEEYSANRAPEPEENVIDQRAYNQHVTAYADPNHYYAEHAQYLDHQQQYAQSQQQHYDPNVHVGDPYAQHAYHYQQQYHYA
jgi:structure-specific recognition protein 1